MSDVRAGDVQIEPVVFGIVGGAAEMPLADAGRWRSPPTCSASATVTSSRGRNCVQSGTRRAMRRRVALARYPIGQMQPRRILAGHDAGARGRADGAGRIGVGKPHALRRPGGRCAASRNTCCRSNRRRPSPGEEYPAGEAVVLHVDLVVLATGMVANSADGEAIRALEDAERVVAKGESESQRTAAARKVAGIGKAQGHRNPELDLSAGA